MECISNTNQLVSAISKLDVKSFKGSVSVCPRTTKLVAIELAQAFNIEAQIVKHVRNQARLAEKLDVSRYTIMRAIKVLQEMKLFESVRTIRGNLYKAGAVLLETVSSMFKPKPSKTPEKPSSESPSSCIDTPTAAATDLLPTLQEYIDATQYYLVDQGLSFKEVRAMMLRFLPSQQVNTVMSKAINSLRKSKPYSNW